MTWLNYNLSFTFKDFSKYFIRRDNDAVLNLAYFVLRKKSFCLFVLRFNAPVNNEKQSLHLLVLYKYTLYPRKSPVLILERVVEL